MIEYELSVNIKAENKEAIENLLITVESISTGKVDVGALELLSISGLSIANKHDSDVTSSYEHDSWLSPLTVEKC